MDKNRDRLPKDSFRKHLDRPKLTLVPEEKAIIHLGAAREHKEKFFHFIDHVTFGERILNKYRAKRAKRLIQSALNVITGAPDNKATLSLKHERAILSMIQEVVDGKREAVQFQKDRSCEFLVEVFTQSEYELHEKKRGAAS